MSVAVLFFLRQLFVFFSFPKQKGERLGYMQELTREQRRRDGGKKDKKKEKKRESGEGVEHNKAT